MPAKKQEPKTEHRSVYPQEGRVSQGGTRPLRQVGLKEGPKSQNAGAKIEREYIIPLRVEWRKVPRYKRAAKAVKAIKEFLVRHMKIYDRDLKKIKIDKYLNEAVWFRGIRKPPAKIKIKAIHNGENVRAELVDYSEKLKFKKAREEKSEKKAKEEKEKKKIMKEKVQESVKEKPEEQTEEKKKEESEKKAAVIEEGKMLEKAKAKEMKHSAGGKTKQPKRQVRKALAK